MKPMIDPLSQLRDIHQPLHVAFWPIASGWFLLAALLIVFGVIGGRYFYRYWKKWRVRKAALLQLKQLHELYEDDEARKQVICELSVLLRRIAFIHHPRPTVAGLKAEAWLNFLNKSGDTDIFTSETGRVLITAPYDQATPKIDHQLFPTIQRWIEKNA
jgi:hypothetical protein